jgi:predicted pyridoxine 5'-phosphate oxidase superfamily flavin-nucleotide-binding protein
VKITDLTITEITDPSRRDQLLATMERERPEFMRTDTRAWVATFQVDGTPRAVAIRIGHDGSVAPDIKQLDTHLRVNEEEFDKDSFISEGEAADVLAAFNVELSKRSSIFS